MGGHLMTLILAQKYDQGIVIAADMLRVTLDSKKNTLDASNDRILKIQMLHKGIGIAVSGLGSLSDACIIAIQSIFKAKLDTSFEEVKRCTLEYFRFAQKQFSTYVIEHSVGMSFLLFGVDKRGDIMMFHYDSRKEFNEVEVESHVSFGSGIDKAMEFLEESELSDSNNPDMIGHNFIHIIRKTSKLESTVGANAHVVILAKEQWAEMAIDENDKFLIEPQFFSML